MIKMDYCKIKQNGKERTFRFKIPTAWDGAAIFNFLSSYGIPFSPSGKVMPPKDLTELMKLCLKYCYEDLPENKAPVVDEDGNIGIIGGENDAPLIVHIAVQYMVFFYDWWKAETS